LKITVSVFLHYRSKWPAINVLKCCYNVSTISCSLLCAVHVCSVLYQTYFQHTVVRFQVRHKTLVEADWHFRGTYCLHLQGDGGGTMHSEMSVYFQETICFYIPEPVIFTGKLYLSTTSHLLHSLPHGHLTRGFLTEFYMFSYIPTIVIILYLSYLIYAVYSVYHTLSNL
jgi:hypothetical protein